jgi:hypothetical protein
MAARKSRCVAGDRDQLALSRQAALIERLQIWPDRSRHVADFGVTPDLVFISAGDFSRLKRHCRIGDALKAIVSGKRNSSRRRANQSIAGAAPLMCPVTKQPAEQKW